MRVATRSSSHESASRVARATLWGWKRVPHPGGNAVDWYICGWLALRIGTLLDPQLTCDTFQWIANFDFQLTK